MLSFRHFPFPRVVYYPCFIQARQLVWPQGYGSTLSAESSFVNGTELTISNAAIQKNFMLEGNVKVFSFFSPSKQNATSCTIIDQHITSESPQNCFLLTPLLFDTRHNSCVIVGKTRYQNPMQNVVYSPLQISQIVSHPADSFSINKFKTGREGEREREREKLNQLLRLQRQKLKLVEPTVQRRELLGAISSHIVVCRRVPSCSTPEMIVALKLRNLISEFYAKFPTIPPKASQFLSW